MTSNKIRHFLRTLCLIMATCMAGCEESTEFAKITASICYIPVSSSTYAPVSREKLSLKCTDLGMFAINDPLIADFLEVVSRGEGIDHFDDNVVRVSIHFSDGNSIYVNKLGEVQSNGFTVKIPAGQLDKFDKRLYRIQERLFQS